MVKIDKEAAARNEILTEAALAASDHLTAQGVAHCLVGRLGLASHGYSTGEVIDEILILLDASEAFSQGDHGMVLTRASLPLSVGEIRVKWATLEEPWERRLWSKELALSTESENIALGSLPLIMCLKMMSDDEDALTLALRDGASGVAAREILAEHEPRLAARLSAMMEVVKR